MDKYEKLAEKITDNDTMYMNDIPVELNVKEVMNRVKKIEEDMSIFDYVITSLVKDTLPISEQNQIVEMMSMMRKTFIKGENE